MLSRIFPPTRFNSCSCSAVKANAVCKNGLCHNLKKAKRKSHVSWSQIFWRERPRWAHFWSGRISKSFTKGKIVSCLNLDVLFLFPYGTIFEGNYVKINKNGIYTITTYVVLSFISDMLVSIFALQLSRRTTNWWR